MDDGKNKGGHEGHDHAEGEDCCLSESPVAEHEATPDEDLPPATGGVED